MRIIATLDPTDARHMIVTVEDITAEVQHRSVAEAIDAERHLNAGEYPAPPTCERLSSTA